MTSFRLSRRGAPDLFLLLQFRNLRTQHANLRLVISVSCSVFVVVVGKEVKHVNGHDDVTLPCLS